MKKTIAVLLGLALSCMLYAQEIEGEQVYEEPVTGAKIFAHNGKIVGFKANGEAELVFGDRKDIRLATNKAILRAKASLAKFMNERLQTKETNEEIVKTMSKVGGDETSAQRSSIETQIEQISNSADAILKGVVIKDVIVNKDEKFVSVVVMSTYKTQELADKFTHQMNTNLYRAKSNNGSGYQGSGSNENSSGVKRYKLKNESLYY